MLGSLLKNRFCPNHPHRKPQNIRFVSDKTVGTICGGFWPSPEERAFLLELALYPNPATDVVLIEVPVSAESRIISFIDVSGVTVYSIDTAGGFHSIDLAGFAPGVYAVVSSDRSLAPKKLIKL